jgi:hypothetical protein
MQTQAGISGRTVSPTEQFIEPVEAPGLASLSAGKCERHEKKREREVVASRPCPLGRTDGRPPSRRAPRTCDCGVSSVSCGEGCATRQTPIYIVQIREILPPMRPSSRLAPGGRLTLSICTERHRRDGTDAGTLPLSQGCCCVVSLNGTRGGHGGIMSCERPSLGLPSLLQAPLQIGLKSCFPTPLCLF